MAVIGTGGNGVNVSLPLNRNFSPGKKTDWLFAPVVIDLIKTWGEEGYEIHIREGKVFVVPLVCNLCVVKFHDPVIILFQIITR